MDDNQKRGEQLNQLSRLLFDAASNKWYWAIGIEAVAGLLGIAAEFLSLSESWKLGFSIIGFLLLAIAYYLRLLFDDMYETAETMRRQSVLTEALGWAIGKTQFSIWRQKAGKKILDTFKIQPRNEGYYVTKKKVGPRKLLEMTLESAFWTRHLYKKLQKIAWTSFIFVGLLSILVISIAVTKVVPDNAKIQVVYAVYIFLPLILSVDLLGWALKLGRLSNAICEVEKGLEGLEGQSRVTEPEVMRLVSEYNCQVAYGFPIPSFLFNSWYKEIQELWEAR
jgi:hypothetical protein